MGDRKMAPKLIVNQNYFDKKIKELRDCFGEQQKEFESAIYKMKVEVKSVDNVESQGGLKQPNFSKMDKSTPPPTSLKNIARLPNKNWSCN